MGELSIIIVICYPNALKSVWVNKEIAYFQSLHKHPKIIMLIKEGELKEVIPSVLDT